MDLSRLGPRHERSAARTAAGLVVASAISVVVGEVAVMVGDSRPFSLAIIPASLVLAGLGVLLWFHYPRVSRLFWFALALCSLVIILVFNLITQDAGGGAQVAFLLPVVYAGAFLQREAAWSVAVVAVVCDAVVVFSLLPLDQALTDHVFILVAIIALTLVLVAAGGRQDSLVAELHRVASIDMLTGLATRRALEDEARDVLGAQVAAIGPADEGDVRPRPLGTALLLIDIDRFKGVNDRYGHPVGDAVLVHIADLLRGAVRRGDTVARFGGDELAVLLPDVARESAPRLAEALRRVVLEHPLAAAGGEIRLTVSIGVAHAAPGVADLDELYRAADAALYQAKRDGRDRVVDLAHPAAHPANRPAGNPPHDDGAPDADRPAVHTGGPRDVVDHDVS